MAKVTFYSTIQVRVMVEADVTPGTEERFCRRFGNWLPGDPPEAKIEKLTLARSNRSVDITDIVDGTTAEALEEEAIETQANEGGDAA